MNGSSSQPRPRQPTTAPGRGGSLSPSASVSEAIHDIAVIALDGVVVYLGGLTADERMTALAERQRGHTSRRQLLRAEVDRHAIDRRIANGRLIVVHDGVFVVGHRAPGPLHAETAALLAVRDGAALSHVSAARLWGIPMPAGAARWAGRDVHVTVAGVAGGDPDGVVVHRSVILTASDIRYRDGLPVTSPARTLLDVAPLLTTRELERALAHVLRATNTTARDVERLLARSGAHPGRAPLTAALAGASTAGFTRSQAEERLLALIEEAGLPRPLANFRRAGYEVDFLWPDANLAVEIDGFAYHGGRDSFEHDRARDVALERVGVTVVRFTWRQLTEEPIAVTVALAQLLAARVTLATDRLAP